MYFRVQCMGNITIGFKIQNCSSANSREKQNEHCINLRKTECINEILDRLARSPSVTPKLWVYAKKSSMVLDRSTQVGRTSRLFLTPKWGFPVVRINTALPSFSTLPYVKQPGERCHSRAGPWQRCYTLGRPVSKLLWLLPEPDL